MTQTFIRHPRAIGEIEAEIERVLEGISQRESEMAARRREMRLWMVNLPKLRRLKEEALDTMPDSVRLDIQPLQDQQEAAWDTVRRLRVERTLAYAVKRGITPKRAKLRSERKEQSA